MSDTKATPLGIAESEIEPLAHGLSRLLADTYTLYVTTQGFHWNVEGPAFASLHAMFEEQYVQLAGAADEIAERIRALGSAAPGSLREFQKLASIGEGGPTVDAEEMVERLVDGHEAIARTSKPLVALAERAGDVATADLVTGRIREHEKTAWMLRSTAA